MRIVDVDVNDGDASLPFVLTFSLLKPILLVIMCCALLSHSLFFFPSVFAPLLQPDRSEGAV